MSLTRRTLTALLLATTLSGCRFLGLSGPTTVGQGKHYATGNKVFDEYFVELYQFQVKLADAPTELQTARETLAKAAEIEAAKPNAELVDKLHARLEKLVAKGIRVKLEVTAPDPPDPAQTSASVKHSSASRNTRILRVDVATASRGAAPRPRQATSCLAPVPQAARAAPSVPR